MKLVCNCPQGASKLPRAHERNRLWKLYKKTTSPFWHHFSMTFKSLHSVFIQSSTIDLCCLNYFKMLYKASILLALAAAINATVLDHISKRNAGLEVTLTEIGNAEVKAVIKNVGDKALKLFTYGTIFDDAPVEKINVFSGEEALPFEGVLRTVE